MTDRLGSQQDGSLDEVGVSAANRQAAGALREGVPLHWTPLRTERLLAATQARMSKRRGFSAGGLYAGGFVLATAAAALVLAVQLNVFGQLNVLGQLSLFGAGENEVPAPVATNDVPEQQVIRFGDGSLAELASATAQIDVERVSPDAIDVNLYRGRSNFRVTPNKARVFTVRAGEVMVTVLGTEFDVEKRGERTWVRVTSGKVSVDWPGGSRLLLPGDEGQFPPDEPRQLADLPLAEEPSEPVPVPAKAASEPAPTQAEVPVAELYRDRATQRDFAEAYQLMKASPEVVGSDVSELLRAADVARLSGHPLEAVPYLKRVLNDHAGDARAASAAFTLGRIYLGQLGSPGEAAQSFAQVRALAPHGPLAEDALAREVEARATAGDKAKAQQLAQQYLRTYPGGRRSAVVRAHAGLL